MKFPVFDSFSTLFFNFLDPGARRPRELIFNSVFPTLGPKGPRTPLGGWKGRNKGVQQTGSQAQDFPRRYRAIPAADSSQPVSPDLILCLQWQTLSFLSWFFFGIPCFLPCKDFLVLLSFFPFFSRDFRGSVGIKKSLFFWWFSLPFSKKTRKGRTGKCVYPERRKLTSLNLARRRLIN